MPSMSSLARRLVWALALFGLAASLASLYVHYQLLVTPGYDSFCDVSASVSCSQAYLSKYGSFMGVPVALLGALWFVFVLLVAWLEASGPPAFRESAPGYLFLASTIALAIILLAYWPFRAEGHVLPLPGDLGGRITSSSSPALRPSP